AGEAHLRDQAAQQRPRHDDDDIAVTRLIERHRLVDEFLGHLPSPFATSASALPWSALLSLSSTAGGIVADFCSSSSTFVVAAIRARGVREADLPLLVRTLLATARVVGLTPCSRSCASCWTCSSFDS